MDRKHLTRLQREKSRFQISRDKETSRFDEKKRKLTDSLGTSDYNELFQVVIKAECKNLGQGEVKITFA